MNAFVAGSGVGVRTGGERRGVCVRKRARWVNRRGVVTAVVEPAQKEAVEKKAVEKEVDVVEEQGNGVVPPEVSVCWALFCFFFTPLCFWGASVMSC
mmetsp:Transcript_13464/g.53950  ORF Transcript_13464/g.53950 Transcript_13464/m.53950 type:complete len:97 (+) Transcript_13464:604-894(+)